MSLLNVLDNLNKPYKIYADTNTLEHGALEQFVDAMEQDFVTRGALMPDAHQGYSLPIGGVVETIEYIVPAWIGYDLGCGMCAVKTTFKYHDVMNYKFGIRDLIKDKIPVGFNKRSRPAEGYGLMEGDLERASDAMYRIFHEKQGDLQLGTLGGGNHFIEISHDEDDNVWIIIHSGSRGVGHGCATHHMKLASPTGKASEGHYGFNMDSTEGRNYLKDLEFCLEFALMNRRIMIRDVVDVMNGLLRYGGMVGQVINRNHNHAESTDGVHWIHRKGATHAEKGMMGVIPGNMRDGSFIVRGKGCWNSLNSSSHGAGRVLGRRKAKETLDIEEFRSTMGNIVAPVDAGHLDESPMAYKDIFEVMRLQSDLVEIVAHCKPIIVVKG